MKFDSKVLFAILKKDLQCLYPLVLLAIAIFAGDVLIMRLELMPSWVFYRVALLVLVSTVLALGVFQLDSPVSLVEDWLCRPVPRRELLSAKLLLVMSVLYGSRVVATLIADLILGYGLVESLLEAVLLQQDVYFMFILPVLLMTAIVTNTLIQGVGVLIAMFVAVFVIPTPLIGPADVFNPRIGEALIENGMGWLVTAPSKIASLVLLLCCYCLVYWRKRILAARAVLVGSTLMTLVLVMSPMFIVPWHDLLGVQAATLPQAQTLAEDRIEEITLVNPRSCFPATRVAALGTDAAFNAARQYAGAIMWEERVIRATAPESLAMLTLIRPRGLPLDWRSHLLHAQADYLDASGAHLFSLRPGAYRTGGADLAHAWLLPESVLEQLRNADGASVELRYSLALLRPEEHELPVDGARHHLPGLGYCSATEDEADNSIDVDCFSAGAMPVQISAELIAVPASRAYGPLDLGPDWMNRIHSRRVELSVQSARLAAHDNIRVTGWHEAGYATPSWAAPGVLGGDAATCPLPTTGTENYESSLWRDATQHETYSIGVEPDVQLEVLDFGGEGEAMVLVPGLGATAHSFDELAPVLAHNHRVIAMTRRGTGASSKPDHGYDTATLAGDILRVMDEMSLERAVLVGHSMAGDELTWLGGHHPERFAALIYLDAAYDRSGRASDHYRELSRLLPPAPPPSPDALRNADAMNAYVAQLGGARFPEGELISLYQMNRPFIAGAPSIDERTQQAIAAGVGVPDYAAVRVPALALYAVPLPGAIDMRPWYDPNDEALRATVRELGEINTSRQRADIERFRTEVPGGKVVELAGAKHYIFQSNLDDVLREIDVFLDSLAGEAGATP